MTADQALARLLEGNERYVSGRPAGPARDERRRNEQAEAQTPFAAILGCADSRVPPEIVLDQGIGDVFVVRVAGNAAADDVTLGSLEFAVAILHCPLLLVLGHEKCGAVKATVDAADDGRLPHGHLAALVHPIAPAVEAARATQPNDLVDAAVKENVRRQVDILAKTFPAARVVGAEYGLHSGRVELVTGKDTAAGGYRPE